VYLLVALRKFFSIILFLYCSLAFGAEPTVQPSNIVVSNINCGSALLQWTSGNGDRRIVIMRETLATNRLPVDAANYSANSFFENGQNLGSANYVVFIGAVNLVNITNLKPNTVYHLAVFEYFNNAGVPNYLTSNPAITSFTTLGVNLNFSISVLDSCWYKNQFNFSNNSTSNFPTTTYKWGFGDFTNATSVSPSKTYVNGGSYKVFLTVFPNFGCKDTIFKDVIVIPKPTISIRVNDSSQCLAGNRFDVTNLTVFPPLNSLGLVRTWDFDDNTTDNIFQPRKIYINSGIYLIKNYIEMTFNNTPTGCRDTGYIPIEVFPNPSGDLLISDTINCIGRNTISFENITPNTISYDWDFGDGNSASGKLVSHNYANNGDFKVIHTASSAQGCVSKDTILIRARIAKNANFAGISSPICFSKNPIALMPINTAGIFRGNGILVNNYVPNLLGFDTIIHIVSDQFCPDTFRFPIEVLAGPKPNLGADINLCNQANYLLSETILGTYTWNGGSNSKSLLVTSSGNYWLAVDDGQCKGSDSINIYFGVPPVLPTIQDTFLCKNSAIKFNFINFDTRYLWNDGTRDSFKTITNAGIYTVSASNPCGNASATFRITKLDEDCNVIMPNCFTPNGDSRNDVYKPFLLSDDIVIDQFTIFNGSGEIVFKGKGKNITWDGTYQGKPVPANQNYFYLLYYTLPIKDNNQKAELKGSIFVLK